MAATTLADNIGEAIAEALRRERREDARQRHTFVRACEAGDLDSLDDAANNLDQVIGTSAPEIARTTRWR
jgi:hypothetical protein